MRQLTINSMNVSSIFGNGQMPVVGLHDVRLDVLRTGKRLLGKSRPATGTSSASSAPASSTRDCSGREQREQSRWHAAATASAWPAAAYEPPAAAWAALVISRAISA